jgi:hypothetical protein
VDERFKAKNVDTYVKTSGEGHAAAPAAAVLSRRALLVQRALKVEKRLWRKVE